MDVLHITSERNLNSIFQHGILRSKPLLTKYNDIMKNLYASNYDQEKGMVFCFPEEHVKRDKFIIDFSYWKAWGNIRNKILEPFNDYEDWEKLNEIGPKFFNDVQPQLDKMKVLLLEIEYEKFFRYYHHQQSHDMGNMWTDMDERYEHNDKPLVLLNYDVSPCKIKRVIGSVESFYEKGKINITLDI
jgi:hypothetical protein